MLSSVDMSLGGGIIRHILGKVAIADSLAIKQETESWIHDIRSNVPIN